MLSNGTRDIELARDKKWHWLENSERLSEFYQLINMFSTIRWIALFAFRTTNPLVTIISIKNIKIINLLVSFKSTQSKVMVESESLYEE